MATKPTSARRSPKPEKTGQGGGGAAPRHGGKAGAGLGRKAGAVDPAKWPGRAVELWDTAKLVPYAKNARTHSDDQITEIARSIETFGWTVPVLVDELGLIIAGHGRILAAARLKIEQAPVIVVRGWSEAQKRAYTIADNKIPLNAGWDLDLLRAELVDLGGQNVDLGLLGFSELELGDLMAGTPSERDPEATPEVPKDPVSRRGDIWLLGAQVRCPKCKKFTPLHEAVKLVRKRSGTSRDAASSRS